MKKTIIFILFLFGTIAFVSAQQRKVLVEQFTNSGCPPCAGNTPVVASYVNTHPNTVLMIAYHTSFPYQDSMYHENPVQSNSRVMFYNVVGVPRSHVDGNYFSGNLLPTLATTINDRSMEPPRYSINFTTSTLNNSTVDVSILLESIDALNQNENLVCHLVLVEKNVLKSSYVCCAGANSENEYPWVMRKMLPDENGTVLGNNYLGGMDVINLTHTVTNFKDLSELRIIAFVQNVSTKEVYQANISEPMNVTAVPKFDNEFDFYFVNPIVENKLMLFFKEAIFERTIEITDILGKPVLITYIRNEKSQSLDLSNFKKGIYFISVDVNGIRSAKKFVIQ